MPNTTKKTAKLYLSPFWSTGLPNLGPIGTNFREKVLKIELRGKIGAPPTGRRLGPIVAVLSEFDRQLARMCIRGIAIVMLLPGVPQKIPQIDGFFPKFGHF
jgi:hypothetical protein